jgi:hypothetical protein
MALNVMPLDVWMLLLATMAASPSLNRLAWDEHGLQPATCGTASARCCYASKYGEAIHHGRPATFLDGAPEPQSFGNKALYPQFVTASAFVA